MDKYEYREKTEQIMKYVQTKSYDKAKEIAETIDWKRVKNASMLCTVSEIYEYTGEYQKSREILFIAYDRSPGAGRLYTDWERWHSGWGRRKRRWIATRSL